jgi:hypothetical protein
MGDYDHARSRTDSEVALRYQVFTTEFVQSFANIILQAQFLICDAIIVIRKIFIGGLSYGTDDGKFEQQLLLLI